MQGQKFCLATCYKPCRSEAFFSTRGFGFNITILTGRGCVLIHSAQPSVAFFSTQSLGIRHNSADSVPSEREQRIHPLIADWSRMVKRLHSDWMCPRVQLIYQEQPSVTTRGVGFNISILIGRGCVIIHTTQPSAVFFSTRGFGFNVAILLGRGCVFIHSAQPNQLIPDFNKGTITSGWTNTVDN